MKDAPSLLLEAGVIQGADDLAATFDTSYIK